MNKSFIPQVFSFCGFVFVFSWGCCWEFEDFLLLLQVKRINATFHQSARHSQPINKKHNSLSDESD